MSKAQASAYNDMKDQMIIDLADYVEEKGELTADIQLTQLLRLQQFPTPQSQWLAEKGYSLLCF